VVSAGLVDYDWSNAKLEWANEGPMDCDGSLVRQAARNKAQNPTAKVFVYLLRPILVYQPKDLNRDWSPRFSTLRDQNGRIRAKTAGNLNLGVSRNRFCECFS
jgi:hypothetical protein